MCKSQSAYNLNAYVYMYVCISYDCFTVSTAHGFGSSWLHTYIPASNDSDIVEVIQDVTYMHTYSWVAVTCVDTYLFFSEIFSATYIWLAKSWLWLINKILCWLLRKKGKAATYCVLPNFKDFLCLVLSLPYIINSLTHFLLR